MFRLIHFHPCSNILSLVRVLVMVVMVVVVVIVKVIVENRAQGTMILVRMTECFGWHAPPPLFGGSKDDSTSTLESHHGIWDQSFMCFQHHHGRLVLGMHLLGCIIIIVGVVVDVVAVVSTGPPPIVARKLVLPPSKFMGPPWIFVGHFVATRVLEKLQCSNLGKWRHMVG
jgi:hypothetical protein